MDMNTENGKKTGGRIKQAASALLNDIGKLPPQAVDIEQIVLGAMMLEKNAVSKTIDILKPASFYDPKHQYIYAAIRELFASTNPIDLITITTLLKKRGEFFSPKKLPNNYI